MTGALAKIAEPKAQLVAGADVAAIIPRSVEEVFRLAQAMAGSGLAPQSLNSPDKVMVAIMAGAELGLPPFQALQSFAVINGRPAIWGDGMVAVARSAGAQIKEWVEGEGEQMIAHCEVTRPAVRSTPAEVIARSFSVDDAKRAGLWKKAGPWTQYPQRMLAMRARSYALRDGMADALRGFQMAEEVQDYQPVREEPAGSGLRARLEAHGANGDEGYAPPEQPHEAEFTAEELDERLDGDDLPELKTGAQLLQEKMEERAGTGDLAFDPAAPEPAAEIGTDLEQRAAAAVGEATLELEQVEVPAELQDRLDSFKRRIRAMDDKVEVHAAGEAVKTDAWFLELKALDRAAAKDVLDTVKDRLVELNGGSNG